MMDRPASRQMDMELDDDAISLTSTQSEKYTSDQEFLVEAILAERKHKDSKMYYLIRWENYPEEKATWEPKKNIQDPDILKAWKERKSKEANGTAEPYNLVRYDALLKEVAKKKKYRHRLRKVKRRRAGIPVSPDVSDSESSEAREEKQHQADAPGIKNKSKAKPSPQRIKKKIQRVLESPASREPSSKPKPISKKVDYESDSSSGLTNDRYVGDKKKASKKALQALREKRAQRGSISEERQSSPGKKAPMEKSRSNSAANIAPIEAALQRDRSSSPEIPLSTTRPLSRVSSATPTVASRQPSPTKAATRIVSTTSTRGRPTIQNASSSSTTVGRGQGSKRGGSVGIKNVFSGGTTRKAKPTFLEQSADPSKKTKHLSNMHQQYSLQMQSRNLADKAPDLDAIGGLYDPANPGKLPAIRPSDLRRTASNTLQGQPDPQRLSPETDSFAEAFDSRRDSIPMDTFPVQVEQAETTTASVPPWHNPDPYSRACWFWRNGSYCSRGNECAYLHTDDMSIPTASEPLQRGQQSAYSTNWKTRPCLYFIAGNCTRGDGCSFLHSEERTEARRDSPAQISGPPADMAPRETVPAANANLSSNFYRPPDGADEDMTLFLPSDPVRPVVPRRAVSFADEPTSMFAEPETYTPNVPGSSVTPRGDELNPMVRQANIPPSISIKKSVSFAEKDPESPVQQHESMAFHDPAQATRKEKRFNKTCIFWVRDECSHGDRCWYNHFYGNVPPPSSSKKELYSSLSVGNSSDALPVSSRYDQSSSTVNRPHLQTPIDFSAPVPDLPLDTSDHMQADSPKSSAQSTTAVPALKIPRAKMSMENYLRKKAFKTLCLGAKEVFFGSDGSQSVVLDFGDVEQTLQHSWGQTFSALANIQFDQMCGARDFEAQKSSIVSQALWEGNLVCDPSDQSALSVLDRVSQELRMHSGGLISTLSDFTILIYPPGEEWNFMDSSTRFTADISLRYLIFKTNLQINGDLTESKWESSLAYRKALTKTIHGLSFAGLVPKRVTDKPYHFFLLFPPSANQTAEFIVSWLKVAWPQQFCKIYTSQTEGSWDHFIRDHFISDPPIEYGVVLIHRSAMPQISELPSIKNLLSKQDIVNFWYIDDSSALFPAIAPPLTSNLGQITASKMFPAFKNAIFLTPSLFVVHPDKAIQAMEWFRRKLKTSTPGNYKLVCSYKIRDYVLDLALDKAAERDDFQERHRDLPTKDAMEESAGLSWKTCESRFDCHRCLTELLSNDVSDGYSSFYDSDYPNEDTSPIIYADESIDPDDEQALVTWFAFWSLTQLDKFRRFTVIGTSPTNPERAKRIKEVPVKDIPGVSPTPVRRQSLIKPFSPGKVKATDKDNSALNNGKLKAAAIAAKLNASAPQSNPLPGKSVEKNPDSVQGQRQPPASTATLRSPMVQSTLQEAPHTPAVSSLSGDNSGRVVGAVGSHMVSSIAPSVNTFSTEAQVEELIATTRAGQETRLPRLVTADVAHPVAMLSATPARGPVNDDYSPVIEQQSYSPQFNGSIDSRPQSSDSASSAAPSGIIDHGNGNRFVPRSIRPSGTIRPERPTRPDFIPIEDQAPYKNRRVVNGVPQYEVPGPHNPITPGMILKAYTNPPRSQATLNVKEGDLVQIVKPVSGTTHLGQNIKTDERGQVPEYIFDRPIDYATPREEGDSPTPAPKGTSSPVETRNIMDVDLQGAILSEVSEDTTRANNESSKESSDPNTIKSADQALDIQIESGVEGEKVQKVKKEIRFEPTTEWYKRLKDEGKGWEHIFVDGWQGAFRYLSLHKEK